MSQPLKLVFAGDDVSIPKPSREALLASVGYWVKLLQENADDLRTFKPLAGLPGASNDWVETVAARIERQVAMAISALEEIES
jgi:hypothetical protein